jgi:uncharacterized protein
VAGLGTAHSETVVVVTMHSLQRRLVIDLKDGHSLLVNPYSGLADVIDTETRDLLDDVDALPEDVGSFLKRRGHIVEEGEEQDLTYTMKTQCSQLHEQQSAINTHIIVVTYDCNLQCPYCFERHLYKKGSEWMNQTMDDKTVDAVFKTILQLDSKAAQPITLYGGEPLTLKNEPIIGYILRKGAEHGYSFSALTNGADLYHFVPLLSQYDIAHIFVTIDGPREIHDQRRLRKGGIGTFDDIVKGVDLALDHHISVGIRVNVDAFNMNYLPDVAGFFKEKGWDSQVYFNAVKVTSFECTYPIISEDEFEANFLELLKDERMHLFLEAFTYPHALTDCLFRNRQFEPHFWNCASHVSTLVYDPLGDIYPCYEVVGNNQYTIGEYLPELEFNSAYDEWRNRTVFTIPECRECSAAFFCGGGCAYAAFKNSGTIFAPYCEKMKVSLEYELPFLYHLLETGRIDLSAVKKWPRSDSASHEG